MSKLCPNCKSENPLQARFCRFCGTAIPEKVEELEQITKSPDTVSDTDFIGLSDIREQLEMFINTLVIHQKQKKIGMPVGEQTNVLVFRGEAGTGKSLVVEWFIGQLQKEGCLSGQKIERTTLHKMQRLYQYDVDISKYLSDQTPAVLLVDEIQTDQNYLHELLLGLTEKSCDTICLLLGIDEGLEKFFKEKSELCDLVQFYDFPSVSDENLVKILDKKLHQGGYEFDREVCDSFSAWVQEAKHKENAAYTNG